MVGPMSTILMGVLILGEPFTAWIAAGTLLVIAGIFVFTRSGTLRSIHMDLGIAGKTALVCGASKGLGFGCALALVREGVNVVIVARGAEALDAAAAKLIAAGAGRAGAAGHFVQKWRPTSRRPKAAPRCSRCAPISTSSSPTPAARRPAISATGTAKPGSRRSTPTCSRRSS